MRFTRRVVAAVVLVLVAYGAPSAAWAAFGAKASGSLRVSTLTLKASADAYGTFTCPSNANNAPLPRGGVSLTGWEAVAGADSYTLVLDPPPNASNVVRTVTSPSRLTMTPTTTPRSGTWKMSIVAKAGTWTGAEWSQTFTC